MGLLSDLRELLLRARKDPRLIIPEQTVDLTAPRRMILDACAAMAFGRLERHSLLLAGDDLVFELAYQLAEREPTTPAVLLAALGEVLADRCGVRVDHPPPSQANNPHDTLRRWAGDRAWSLFLARCERGVLQSPRR